jgi:hypothetical protein
MERYLPPIAYQFIMLCVLEITLVSCFELSSVAILYICLRVQAPLSLSYHIFLYYIPPLF